jgi:hypothetical protein
MQRPLLRLEVTRELKRDKSFEVVEGQCEGVTGWKLVRELQVRVQEDRSEEEYLVILKKSRGVIGILEPSGFQRS